jgi:DNA-binding NarL/FixJ family response regulator
MPANQRTSILITEDDPLLCSLLAEALGRHDGFEVLGVVQDGREVAEEVERRKPDLLLLDLGLPGLPGLEVIERLHHSDEPPRILVLSGDEGEDTQFLAARAGAQGFVPKSAGIAGLPEAIREVARGGAWFSRAVANRIFADYPKVVRRVRESERPAKRLTDRERQILARVARGMTNQEIAAELFMSVSSVKVYLRTVLRKLNLPNRIEAALFAVREGLVDSSDNNGSHA